MGAVGSAPYSVCNAAKVPSTSGWSTTPPPSRIMVRVSLDAARTRELTDSFELTRRTLDLFERFQFLAAETAGDMPPRTCLEHLSQAATKLPDPDGPPRVPKLVRVRFDSPPEGRAAEGLLIEIEQIAREIR